MIVVVNPSDNYGHSFKGLHAYASHDADGANTSERVEWMQTNNLAYDDPHQAWKIMIATASAQNDLKKSAGHRAGRASKEGPVLHIVMNFAEGEPQDEAKMKEAANGLLSELGEDFTKKRGKGKRDRVQFADEHQSIVYCHTDSKTGQKHLHIMVNRVHPVHGLNLPDGNDQLKAQKWALKYSKEHGTDDRTPAREENQQARADGEYVKGARRVSRNVYEMQQAMKAAGNDNARAKAFEEKRVKAEAALALRGRNLAKMHTQQSDQLVNAHRERKAAIARGYQRDINKAKSDVREAYRPKWRDLERTLKGEQKVFKELESTWFGRTKNTLKAINVAAHVGDGEKSNLIARSFKIISNAGERKAFFERGQERRRQDLKREQRHAFEERQSALQDKREAKLEDNRATFEKERAQLQQAQASEQADLKKAWRERIASRNAALKAFAAGQSFDKAASPSLSDRHKAALLERYANVADLKRVSRDKSSEQDNSRDRDKGDRER